ncbi:TELO2-interacting protein 1 homolog [Battus philenor]|uniref:TELO2-interacting protein 1 homolog n=1 Tax=Battus philenor TaxID=42288 RepID=UPI0035D0FDA4
MNLHVKDAFDRMKPVCDVIMVCPTLENVFNFVTVVKDLKKEHVQELQQYLLYPLITHIRSPEMKNKIELQRIVVDAMIVVLEKISVDSYEMCLKILTGLLPIIFDKSKPGMIASVPEELKLSIMRCLTALMLDITTTIRIRLFKAQVPLLAQIVFVSVHIAKLEKLRSLRLAAIKCLMAHTSIHEKLTDESYHIKDSNIEPLAVDLLSSILPGVMAALQDVAMSTDNPGHAVVVSALNAIHRVLCTTMHDKLLDKKRGVTAQDFANMIAAKSKSSENDVSNRGLKDIVRRSQEWYDMASEKLALVIKSLVPLSTHDHVKVRKEFAVLCARILTECNESMQHSIPIVLDVLISLSKDEYQEVSTYCAGTVNAYFSNTPEERTLDTMDNLCTNLHNALINLPRILNNIDSSRKLAALNLVHGYISVLSEGAGPQKLTAALTSRGTLQALCDALRHAAALHTRHTLMTTQANREVLAIPETKSPWLDFRHLDTAECLKRLTEICQLLGEAECAELLLDHLLELFQQRECELAFIINCFGSAPKTPPSVSKRILETYLEEDLWYLPLEISSSESPISKEETYDINVYNPRAWVKDSVPGLYEGATEIRYTGISYERPRATNAGGGCINLAQAQRNLVLCCQLTEGVGAMALNLQEQFQPYLVKTLCLILERVGSRYELLHSAGLKSINMIAQACGHGSVAELIAANADYFTNQVTARLKKVWNIQSALEILTVVMEHSDSSILDYLYGIVEDVLLHSCDKYHEKDLYAFLQVFLTFITCIRKWFHIEIEPDAPDKTIQVDILKDVLEFAKNKEEAERLLNESEEDCGKSVEEMYREDLKRKEDEVLDYDDTVTKESAPLPRHVTVTVLILKRTINFVTSQRRDDVILSMRILTAGLPVLKEHEDELLPLVHATWAPLCAKFETEPSVTRLALELLDTMAVLSKDFIRSRALKDILPSIYKFLRTSCQDSLLKDKGSAYRTSSSYRLQEAALNTLPSLARHLHLDDDALDHTLFCVRNYLSNKQPKPLQELAVSFFKQMLSYKYGVTWYHLRKFCRNERLLPAPHMKHITLQDVTGTPYRSADPEYDKNIKLIFKKNKS